MTIRVSNSYEAATLASIFSSLIEMSKLPATIEQLPEAQGFKIINLGVKIVCEIDGGVHER